MKELLIRHEQDGHVIKRFRFKPDDRLYTIGSSRNCDIRVLGDDVDLMHACFEYVDDHWKAIDLSSESGTWINDKAIIEQNISDFMQMSVGQHKLSINVVEVNNYNIFRKPTTVNLKGEKPELYQQVAFFYHDILLSSELVSPKKKVVVPYDKKKYHLPLPTGPTWSEKSFGDLKVKTRLVKATKFENDDKSIWSLFPEDLVKPMGASLGATLLFLLSLYIIPMALKSDPGKIDENQYTRLMFDQKTIEKQRKKAKKLAKSLEKKEEAKKPEVKKKAPKKVAQKKAAPPKVNVQKKKVANAAPSRSNNKVKARVSRVANSIKAAGLSSLISKVSARAASNAKLVKTSGVKAGKKTSGRGFASLSDMNKGGKLGSAATKGSFRIGSVSTKGEAGGTTVSGRLGGLSGSSVGSASVSSLEGETEVDGGLTADQIRSVVKKNLGAVRYCYERQLTASPGLFGKIKVEFVINSQGQVITQKVKSTTMNNKMVEGCILRKIKRWAFPIPNGGTEVAVSYPFFFKSTK